MILEVTFEVLRCLSRCPPRETGDLDVFVLVAVGLLVLGTTSFNDFLTHDCM
ncbi:hypothetical protein Csa_006899 [Cucumis sativus]|uniref:Uncharacterized protein n=1 Tax=Cucumis sativus TaxID=3659 RepID=A0A0A0LY87_CUCSA|nr:hypothetical protein Csa_006899 [Cucumis sativus]